jgi:hypothetical protein
MRIHRSLLALATLAVSACSNTVGQVLPQDLFVHPNSTVRVIGPVSASATKVRLWGIGAQFDPEEALAVHRKALTGQPGANVIVDVSEDTTTTVYPFYPLIFISTTYKVTGQGAEVLVYDPSAAESASEEDIPR